ncbi:MAG: T9SS type A sorting domain-containing protein [Sphingobacteriales bacterium]|nr:T9SS type A sorting domain-containing protein [Sphingobacteriales bacterium]
MKNIIILLLIYMGAVGTSVAQTYNVGYHSCTSCNSNNPNYNTNPSFFELTGAGVIDVVSDFGRRNGTGISNWHRGVDITLKDPATDDTDFHLLSIVGGKIARIQGNAGGFKLISIEGNSSQHHFGYGHIFDDKDDGYPIRRGDMTIVQFKNNDTPPKDELAIIHHPVGGTPVAYANSIGININFTHPFTNLVYSLVTTNIVAQNQPIAPLGTSGNVASHLHLYRFVDPYIHDPNNLLSTISIQDKENCKDPLTLLSHYGTQYHLDITTQFDNGGANSSEAKVRVTMEGVDSYGIAVDQYYKGGLMNVDQVEVLIKKTTDDEFNTIKGKKYDWRICENSRVESVPPDYGFYPNSSSITENIGSYTKQGIMPFAYGNSSSLLNTPYDDFYFTDFPLRIHKDDNYGGDNAKMAPLSEAARYPDGKYDLLAEVTNIKGIITPSDQQEITIDNFLPYVKSIVATNGAQTFESRWEWNEGTQKLCLTKQGGNLNITDTQINLTVLCSEPMSELKWLLANNTSISGNPDDTFTEWQFILPAEEILPNTTQDQYLKLVCRFEGKDIAGNKLMDFSNKANQPEPCISGSELPYRQSNTLFMNEGGGQPFIGANFDASHAIPFNCPENPECLQPSFDIETPAACSSSTENGLPAVCLGTHVTLQNTTPNCEGCTYQWSFYGFTTYDENLVPQTYGQQTYPSHFSFVEGNAFSLNPKIQWLIDGEVTIRLTVARNGQSAIIEKKLLNKTTDCSVTFAPDASLSSCVLDTLGNGSAFIEVSNTSIIGATPSQYLNDSPLYNTLFSYPINSPPQAVILTPAATADASETKKNGLSYYGYPFYYIVVSTNGCASNAVAIDCYQEDGSITGLEGGGDYDICSAIWGIPDYQLFEQSDLNEPLSVCAGEEHCVRFKLSSNYCQAGWDNPCPLGVVLYLEDNTVLGSQIFDGSSTEGEMCFTLPADQVGAHQVTLAATIPGYPYCAKYITEWLTVQPQPQMQIQAPTDAVCSGRDFTIPLIIEPQYTADNYTLSVSIESPSTVTGGTAYTYNDYNPSKPYILVQNFVNKGTTVQWVTFNYTLIDNATGCRTQEQVKVAIRPHFSSLLNVECVNLHPITGIHVNELSLSNNGIRPYVELVVTGTPCDLNDIRRFIIDDNNGSTNSAFSNNAANAGVSKGYIRFKDIPRWQQVPTGSLILIYDKQNKNSSINIPDDPTDINKDGVYVVPVNDIGLEWIDGTPSPQQNGANEVPYYEEGISNTGNWNAIKLRNSGDAMQVRTPSGYYYHGISYGDAYMHGGNDNLKLSGNNGSDKVFKFEDGDFRQQSRWQVGSTSAQSPGIPNNPLNVAYINALKCDETTEETKAKTAQTYHSDASVFIHITPNPFEDRFIISAYGTSTEVEKMIFTLYDVQGKEILHTDPIKMEDNYVETEINVPQLVVGVYFLRARIYTKSGMVEQPYKLVKGF